MKLILAMVLVSSMSIGEVFAQSAVRADEKINNPESYRLGDSEDLQADQMIVEHVKDQKQKGHDLNHAAQLKRLLKHRDMI